MDSFSPRNWNTISLDSVRTNWNTLSDSLHTIKGVSPSVSSTRMENSNVQDGNNNRFFTAIVPPFKKW